MFASLHKVSFTWTRPNLLQKHKNWSKRFYVFGKVNVRWLLLMTGFTTHGLRRPTQTLCQLIRFIEPYIFASNSILFPYSMKASRAIATRSYICVLTNKKAKVLNSRNCFTLIQIFFKPLSTQSSSFYCGHAHGPSPQSAAGRSPTRVSLTTITYILGQNVTLTFFIHVLAYPFVNLIKPIHL